MAFKSRYGEPEWKTPPVTIGNIDYLTPRTNGSYEENRLAYEEQFMVPLPEKNYTTPRDIHHSSLVEMFNHSSTLSPWRLRFLEWSQSDPVNVLVGPNQTRFRIPSDFLTKRSDFFQTTLESPFQEASDRVVHLPTTAEQTFEHVAVWVMSSQPELDQEAPFPVIVDIAIFATIYLFDAMLHQALDVLRAHIISHHDALTPEIVKHIYGQVDKHSLLRHLTRAALAVFTQAKMADQALESWIETIEQCEALGADFFYVQMKKWTLSHLAEGGTCRFHRHAANPSFEAKFPSGMFCSRSAHDCFESIANI